MTSSTPTRSPARQISPIRFSRDLADECGGSTKNRAAMVYTQELHVVFFANAQNLRHSSTSQLVASLGMPLAGHGLALEFSNQRTLRHDEATEFRGFFPCCFRGARRHEFPRVSRRIADVHHEPSRDRVHARQGFLALRQQREAIP